MMRKDVKTEEDVINLLPEKTEFEKKVLATTFKIPKGKISTYKRIAMKIGKPNAYRAVANALRKNPLHPIVPCHRVVKSDGSFGGNRDRAEARRKIVAEEGVPIEKGRVKLNKKILYWT